MCTNTRLIRNKYTGKILRVACGVCPACLQQKANARTMRIRNNSCDNEINLFGTLTYSNDFLPYILKSDVGITCDVPIYRNATVRYYRDKEIVKRGTVIIDSAFLDSGMLDASSCPAPKGFSNGDAVSIIYYKDFQNFVKRLRINLQRYYDYTKPFKIFQCAEYGPATKRAHMHFLLQCPKSDEQILRTAIIKSWSFCDKSRTEKFLEIARDAASYVSSYVNSHLSSTSFYKNRAFRQKHSHSKDYGVRRKCFSLPEVLEKVRNGNLRYNITTYQDGIPCVSAVPVPKYVINRFFPKFKGYSVVTDNEIRKLLLSPAKLFEVIHQRNGRFEYEFDEIVRFERRLYNIRKLFKNELDIDYDRFSIFYPVWYTMAWNVRNSNVLQDSYDRVVSSSDWYDFYENISDIDFGLVRSDSLSSLVETGVLVSDKFVRNPNTRLDIVNNSSKLHQLYLKKDKTKKILNHVMSRMGYDV